MVSSFDQIGTRLTEICDKLSQYTPYAKNDSHILTLLNGYTHYVVSVYVKAKQGLITEDDIMTVDRVNKIFVMTVNLALTAKTKECEIQEGESKILEFKEKLSMEKARQKFEFQRELIKAMGLKPEKNSLHLAAQQGNEGFVKVFIEAGDSLFKLNKEGNTPLACAILSGKKKVAEILKKYDHRYEKFTNFSHETYLHLAIRSHAIEMVKWVLTWSFADLEVKNKAGQTPLILAIITNQKDVVDYFLYEKKVSYSLHEVLKTALINASPELFTSIFPKKADASTGAPDLLEIAITHGKIAQADYLLSRNIPFKVPEGRTLLHLAVGAGQVVMVEWLLNSKKKSLIDKSDDRGITPLALAISEEKVEIAQILIKMGAKIELLDLLPLCIQNEKLECMDLLFRHTLKVDFVDRQGCTLLELAIKQGRVKLVEYLITKGALNLVEDSNESVHKKNLLHLAVLSKKSEIVDSILSRKPSYKYTKDENHETPLELAKRLKLGAIIDRLSGNQGKGCSCVIL